MENWKWNPETNKAEDNFPMADFEVGGEGVAVRKLGGIINVNGKSYLRIPKIIARIISFIYS